MNVIAYCRVSTPEQAKRGFGLASQRGAITAWAATNRHTVMQIFEDAGLSGDLAAADRPGLTDALAALDANAADGVCVFALDRIGRTLTTQEAILARVWSESGRRVFTVAGEVPRDDPDDPMRTAMRQMVGVFAQLEKAQLLRRMRLGRKTKASQGGFAYGSPPFGYRADAGVLVKDPAEQATIRRIKTARASGVTMRAIAADLNTAGLLTKRGRPWTSGAVSDVLTRSRSTKPERASA